MVYKFRVILDSEEDVFRDIAISSDDTLEDFHNAIINAFGFDGSEGGSFYTCNDQWQQNEEISLFDLGDEPGTSKTMIDFKLSDLLDENNTKILYIYDPFNMWVFFVELAAIEDELNSDEKELPALLFAHGTLPSEAPSNNYDSPINTNEMFDDFENDFDDEDFDMFDGDDSFQDFDYDDLY